MLSIVEDLLEDANSFCRKACLQVEEEYFRNELLSKRMDMACNTILEGWYCNSINTFSESTNTEY